MEMTEWFITAILAIEVLFRVVPTAKNWSVLETVYSLLNAIVPNRRVGAKDAD